MRSRIIRLAVSAALLAALIVYLGGVGDIGARLSGANPLLLLVAFLVMTLDRVLMAYKWLLLLRARGPAPPLLDGLKIYCASMVWGIFLPTTVGADAIRGYLASRAGVDGYRVAGSIIVERMIGFIAALILGLIGLVILSSVSTVDARFHAVWQVASVVLFAAVAVLLLSFNASLFHRILRLLPSGMTGNAIIARISRLHEAYSGFGAERRTLGAFFALTLLEQLFPIVATWTIARALDVQLSPLVVAGAVPLAILVSRLPVSFDGVGVYEGIFVLGLGLAGVGAAEALAIALAARVIQTLVWVPWWLSYTLADRRSGRPADAPSRWVHYWR